MPDAERSTKIQLGAVLTMLGMLAAAMWQASTLRDDVRTQLFEDRIRNTEMAGEIRVLSTKVGTLENAVRDNKADNIARLAAFQSEVKEQLTSLERRVDESGKRNQ